MTAATSEQLAKLMSGVELLVLEFDGPICSVFAGLAAPVVADRLRQVLTAQGVEMTLELQQDEDPLSIYRRSAVYGTAVTAEVFNALVAAEFDAVATATPTPGATAVIYAAREVGRMVAIVSNNAAVAVAEYLRRHGLLTLVDHIAARRTPEPELMKPSPAYLDDAANTLGFNMDACVLVGDSVSDIEAGRRAGVSTIGFANKPGKAGRLGAAGADAVIDDMTQIVAAAGMKVAE